MFIIVGATHTKNSPIHPPSTERQRDRGIQIVFFFHQNTFFSFEPQVFLDFSESQPKNILRKLHFHKNQLYIND